MLSYSANPLAFIMKNKNIIQIIFFNTDLWSCFSLDLLIIQHSKVILGSSAHCSLIQFKMRHFWLKKILLIFANYEYLFPKFAIKSTRFSCHVGWFFWVLHHIYSTYMHDLYSLLFLEQKMFLVHCMLIVCYTFFFLCCKWMLSANCLCVQKMHFEDAIIPIPHR